jgi:4-hydroxyphenylpyruvate dioxygenase
MKNSEGVLFAFSSPYTKDKKEMNDHQAAHGDGVRDVAFRVEDCRAIFQKAVSRGAKAVSEPREEKDEHGSVILASVQTYGDTIHTFVQRDQYKGFFLPGYAPHPKKDPL